jgi:hypothetical protein
MFRSSLLRTVASVAAAVAAVAIGTGGVVSATSAAAPSAGATYSASDHTVSGMAMTPASHKWY